MNPFQICKHYGKTQTLMDTFTKNMPTHFLGSQVKRWVLCMTVGVQKIKNKYIFFKKKKKKTQNTWLWKKSNCLSSVVFATMTMAEQIMGPRDSRIPEQWIFHHKQWESKGCPWMWKHHTQCAGLVIPPKVMECLVMDHWHFRLLSPSPSFCWMFYVPLIWAYDTTNVYRARRTFFWH